MNILTSNELRDKYLKFFEKKGHKIIESASLIPVNDPSVLFTTAGMHPLVPYLLGEEHPYGKRLTDVQKCVRTGDIDEVGDSYHCTFFEMLGNWSLGDYFKQDSIKYSFEFLTKVLGIEKERIAVTVFAGDENAPRDDESAKRWKEMGLNDSQIFFLSKENNWWWAGQVGPCGPDTEIFYKTDKKYEEENNTPASDKGPYVEIWNNVFMEYFKNEDGSYTKLKQKNVDTGMGLERTLCILQNVDSVYDTDLFTDIIKEIEKLSCKKYKENKEDTRAMRIIADHIRTATFIMGDQRGVTPSNVDQGYVVRRLIRRAVRFSKLLGMQDGSLSIISNLFIEKYKLIYPELQEKRNIIINELELEISKFEKTIENGLKEIEKVLMYVQNYTLNGKTAFRLYDTFGFPLEMTIEIAKEKGYDVDIDGFNKAFKDHQEKSQKGAEQKFKGGLANTSQDTVALHTATHLLLAALKKVLGNDINQKGSNITEERLRFDFNFSRPMEKEEIKKVEDLVNEIISKNIPVICKEMKLEEAKKMGATGVFDNKYQDIVKVYQIGDFSLELCGGPHVRNTGDLGNIGKFKIKKEQSSSSGVRRIKAVLEKE